jgi:hypothetical protein
VHPATERFAPGWEGPYHGAAVLNALSEASRALGSGSAGKLVTVAPREAKGKVVPCSQQLRRGIRAHA